MTYFEKQRFLFWITLSDVTATKYIWTSLSNYTQFHVATSKFRKVNLYYRWTRASRAPHKIMYKLFLCMTFSPLLSSCAIHLHYFKWETITVCAKSCHNNSTINYFFLRCINSKIVSQRKNGFKSRPFSSDRLYLLPAWINWTTMHWWA